MEVILRLDRDTSRADTRELYPPEGVYADRTFHDPK